MNILRFRGVAAFLAALAVASCGGGDGIGGTGASTGSLRLALTDAPACGYDQVNVTIQKIRVHQDAAATDNDAGWSEIVPAPVHRVDLLTLTNGVLSELGETTLPAGKYTQLRLVLAPNNGDAPFANSVIPTASGIETALGTPSAQQSGLKVNVDITVPVGKEADFILDFNACKSVVKAGNSGRYNLKPVITVTPRLSDAGMRVVGVVAADLVSPSTIVSLQHNGSVVKATTPGAGGTFVLYPVPAGTYDLIVTSVDHATAVITGVPVVITEPTEVSSASTPIAPATAASGPVTLSGTLAPPTGTLRARQALTGGPLIEAAWVPVDATSGAFQFGLLAQAPVRTAFVANPVALTLLPDSLAAGKYTLEASSGAASQLRPIDLNGALPSLDFVFP